MADRKVDDTRSWIAFGLVIIMGLVIGIFIRRVHVGLLIGLVLGVAGSRLLKRR